MYLNEVLIRNNGPLADLHVEFTFNDSASPIPHVFVGANGSGKSNLLSIIADALIEAAAKGHTDAVESRRSIGRSYFRIVGGQTIRFGTQSSLSLLRLTESDKSYYFSEKAGLLDPEVTRDQVPESMKAGIVWGATDDGSKQNNMEQSESRDIFGRGVYTYFPASRSERPHWLNREAIPLEEFDITARIQGQLGRPLYVERAIDKFAQWVLSLFMESKSDLALQRVEAEDGGIQLVPIPANSNAVPGIFEAASVLSVANQILRIIMKDHQARFVWLGRHSPNKLGVATVQAGSQPPALRLLANGLGSLSGGQSTLLAVFGTLLMDGDATVGRKSFSASDIHGIVVIDEIDAHMHVDLQVDALPRLISLFTNVQFVLSSHSPLFSLGMEKTLTPAGVRIIELPHGIPITAEAYEEFGRAMDALADTQAFSKAVAEAAKASDVPIVWLAGETDPKYFEAAARVLGFEDLANREIFRWIGYREGPGRTSNTGDPALNKAFNLFKAHPNIVNQPMVLVYDSDANKPEVGEGRVSVLSLPLVETNRVARKGIENLLPPAVFTEDAYDERVEEKEYGNTTTIRELNKMRLCEKLCKAPQPETFENFRPILTRIRQILGSTIQLRGQG